MSLVQWGVGWGGGRGDGSTLGGDPTLRVKTKCMHLCATSALVRRLGCIFATENLTIPKMRTVVKLLLSGLQNAGSTQRFLRESLFRQTASVVIIAVVGALGGIAAIVSAIAAVRCCVQKNTRDGVIEQQASTPGAVSSCGKSNSLLCRL